MKTKAVNFRWTADLVMVPDQRALKLCEEQFVVNEVYPLTTLPDRSKRSHDHYFACISEIYANLPERLASKFKSEEHMRKYALVKCGFCNEKILPCGSYELAESMAATIREHDGYCVMKIEEGNVLHIWTAKSQSKPAMPDGDEFQQSKQQVLDYLTDLVGVTRKEIQRAAARTVRPGPNDKIERPKDPRLAIGANLGPPLDAPPPAPKTADEYVAYAERWIAACGDPEDGWARFEGEKEQRDALGVKITVRTRLRDSLYEKFKDG